MTDRYPERDLVFATAVEGQKDSWIIDLSCGHKKAVRERKATYVCRECPKEPDERTTEAHAVGEPDSRHLHTGEGKVLVALTRIELAWLVECVLFDPPGLRHKLLTALELLGGDA